MTPDPAERPGGHGERPGGPALPGPARPGSIIEVGLEVVLRRWRPLLALALLFVGPAALLTASTGAQLDSVLEEVRPQLGRGPVVLTVAQFDRLSAAFVGFGLATILAGILASVGAVAMSAAVLGPRGTWAAEMLSALRVTLRRTPSVIAFMLLTSAIVVALALLAAGVIFVATAASPAALTEGGPAAFAALLAGVSLVLALLYLTMRWSAAYPVMAVEEAGWRTALSRSWSLTADNVLRSGAVVVAAALLTLVGTASIGMLLSLGLAILLGGSEGTIPLLPETLVTAGVTVLLAPLSPVFLAVLYVDLRARRAARSSRTSLEDDAAG